MSKAERSLVLYLPVFHRGYIELFARHPMVTRLWIIGEELLEQVGYREKEIRALKPVDARQLALALNRFERVDILTPATVSDIPERQTVVASDEVTRAIFREKVVAWDTAFLRWDTAKVFSQEPSGYDRVVAAADVPFMFEAEEAAHRTSDWWRQVGAVLIKDGAILYAAYNKHLPSEHTPYAVGDPRDFVQAGQHSELASAAHAEQQIIAFAARDGVSLKDTALLVTVFPCPVCAKLIALSGIRWLYFRSGHASLDGQHILKANHVELVLVQ